MSYEARAKHEEFEKWQESWEDGEPCPVCGAKAFGASNGRSRSLAHKQAWCGDQLRIDAKLEADEQAKQVIRRHRIWIRSVNAYPRSAR